MKKKKRVPFWLQILALLRISKWAVCRASSLVGPVDFHTLKDGDGPRGEAGWSFNWHRCKRCGKEYMA